MRFHPRDVFVNGTITANLFVSSYIGTISTLQLSRSLNGSYSLNTLSVNNVTTDNPSWLHKDPKNGILYCLNEGLSVTNGSISSFTVADDGTLTLLGNGLTISGPVSSVLFNEGKTMAAAHYNGASLTTHNIQADGTLSPLQTITFTMPGPGPDPLKRQLTPHPHEALLDPSEKYIIVPDLGADLVRVFSIDPATALLTELTPYTAPPASGPRHGVFHVTDSGDTYFYLVSELANTVSSFKVTYGEGSEGLTFTNIDSHGIYGDKKTPEGAAAAECLLTPDGKHILTSSRNATILSLPQPPAHPLNSTALPSDTLQTWSINTASNGTYGSLSFSQLFPSGGIYPRQMSMNKAGTLVAVALQQSARVVIVKRDVKTGLFGDFVADVQVGDFEGVAGLNGQVTSVVWDEVEEIF
ncbi:uncharacterized protein EAF02_008835 [Botrytis sinoallii]|uniref:uncharacterized protein n=1 Tax=Botrytis sinoallii TaxID=1463999 RepID=UPI0019003743|nr:uncharacterized protein EAF02_008835 [Botrytis sinoallii]KAF7872764.1 hypothetical protein EAF02_008835 [Botrytis sinoallii]